MPRHPTKLEFSRLCCSQCPESRLTTKVHKAMIFGVSRWWNGIPILRSLATARERFAYRFWWRDFAELVIFAFLICYLYSVRGQEPLHHYAVWHYILRELSTIQRIQDFGFCIFNIAYSLAHWALRCMPQVPLILGELGMEFLDLQDSRFSFADTGQAKQTGGSTTRQ